VRLPDHVILLEVLDAALEHEVVLHRHGVEDLAYGPVNAAVRFTRYTKFEVQLLQAIGGARADPAGSTAPRDPADIAQHVSRQ
jgi:hypothetical protein